MQHNDKIKIKRIYETPSEDDGYRMLIDRLWPRGMKKESAMLNEWNKEIAPSTELRKWFNHKAPKFSEFVEKYEEELSDKDDELKRLREIAHEQTLTLLYAAKDEEVNHAVVLQDVLNRER